MAKILTIPEVVNVNNRNYLQKLVLKGCDDYPGSMQIISKNGKEKFQLTIKPEMRKRRAEEL